MAAQLHGGAGWGGREGRELAWHSLGSAQPFPKTFQRKQLREQEGFRGGGVGCAGATS